MRRAVASAVGRTSPPQTSSGRIVGDQRAGGGDNGDVVDHQGRTGEAPVGNVSAGIGRDVTRPHQFPVLRVERIQNAGRTKGIDAIPVECRRRSRTCAAVRLPEADGITMAPYRFAGGYLVSGDDFVFTALLLCIKNVATDGKR